MRIRYLAELGCLLPVAATGLLPVGVARAAEEGLTEPWQLWHPSPATPLMEQLGDFHQLLLWIMVAICVLVVALMAYVIVRYNAARHPTPSRASHNTMVEVLWTLLPAIILVVIAIPSFRLLYYSDRAPDAEMTIKVTGHQWYWEYQYPDHGDFSFVSTIVPENELQPGQPRLLTVDNPVVLPVGTTVRILVTAGDVLHSWSVPAFGVKMDGVPGQLNETWALIKEEGMYYGQCYQICGINHAYMPVAVQAVSKERFAQWVEEARAEFAGARPPAPVSLAEGATPAAQRSEP